MFWFTTTGWMMWNFLVGACSREAAIVLYDGSPGHPDLGALWELAERPGSPAWAQRRPDRELREGGRRAGAATRPERAARDRLDRLAARAGGLSLGLRARRLGHLAVLDERRHGRLHGVRRRLPAAAGLRGRAAVPRARLRGRGVGRATATRVDRRGGRARDHRADALDAAVLLGRRRTASALRESYFAMYPGVWRHGDWIRITPRGGAVIYGRSDSTINRQGVRMGTSEIYRAAASLPTGARRARGRHPARPGEDELRMILFVVLARGRRARRGADDADQAPHPRGLLAAPRAKRGPPDRRGPAHAVGQGARGAGQADPDGRRRPSEAASVDSLANPAALDYFVELAGELDLKPSDPVGPPAA